MSLEASVTASFKEGSQYFLNPGGILQKGGLIFHLTVGFGLDITFTYPPVPVPTMLELEAGLLACSRSAKFTSSKSGMLAAAMGSAEGRRLFGAGLGDEKTIRSSELGVDDMFDRADSGSDEHGRLGASLLDAPTDIVCVDDPYGDVPAMIKIALFVDLKTAGAAFMVSIQNLSLGRLLYIFLATPEPGILEPLLKVLSPILDLVKFDVLEASVNSMPFPVTLTSGTTIGGGIYFNVEKFNFFGFIKAEKVMVRFDPIGGIFDVQVFMDPMKLEIGGVTLLEVKGVTQEDKFTAKEAIAAKAAARAKEAKEKRIEMEATLAKIEEAKNKRKPPAPTCPLGATSCQSCSQVLAQQEAKIDCGRGRGYVVSKILSAVWAVDSTKPDWDFNRRRGKCEHKSIDTD